MEFLEGLFTLHNLFTLMMLVLLQAVLGFDNLLYISIESKRVEPALQPKVRRLGIGLAIFLRIVLLFAVKGMIEAFEQPFLSFGTSPEDASTVTFANPASWVSYAFNLESFVELFGGGFIMYTALKEIFHMISDHGAHAADNKPTRGFGAALFWIVLMNLVFSFDSILSAMALTENLIVMSVAIMIGGLLMILLADNVAEFLKKNRMYEILGLFILFIVGVMLVSEGGHKAHVVLFGHPVEAMQKSTFYFVIAVLVIVDMAQSRYQKKLLAA